MRHADAHANLARLHASTLGSSSRAVFLVLAVYAGDDGLCWPSVGMIGAAAGMNPANVRRHLVALVAAGLVSIVPGGGRGHTNLYRLPAEVVPNPRGSARVSAEETRADPRANPRESARRTRADSRDEVVRESTRNGAAAPTICPLCGQPVTQLGKWRHAECSP